MGDESLGYFCRGRSPIFVEDGSQVRGKRVLVVEDGPTLTHGEMPYGAGWVAARRYGAAGWLLLGAAGSFIDPLSSYGVKKALASAWMATHSIILRSASPVRIDARAFLTPSLKVDT